MTARRAISALVLALLAGGAIACAADRTARLEERVRALRDAAAHGAPGERAPRLVELGESLLASAGVDGADSAVLFGVPLPEQRERVRALAGEALRGADLARAAIDEGVRALEERPDYAENAALQDERSRLAVELGELRLPMARARAAALLASVADTRAERTRLLGIVAESIGGLSLDRADAESERLVLVGLAQPTAFEDALRVAPVGSRASVEAALGLALGAAARAGDGPAQARAWLAARAEQQPFKASGRADAGLQSLAAGALVRIGLEEAHRAGPGPLRAAALERATAPLLALLQREDTGLDYEARRALALALAAAAPFEGEPAELPALVLLARAHEAAARSDGTAQARALVDLALRRSEASLGATFPELRYENALLLDRAARTPSESGPGAAGDALRAWSALARAFPGHPASAAARRRACEIALAISDALADADDAMRRAHPLGPDAGEALRQALDHPDPRMDVNRVRIALGLLAPGAEGERMLASVPDDAGARSAEARLLLLERRLEGGGQVGVADAPGLLNEARRAREALGAARPALGSLDRRAEGIIVRAQTAALLAEGRADEALACALEAGSAGRDAAASVCAALGEAAWLSWLADDTDRARASAGLALRAGAGAPDAGGGIPAALRWPMGVAMLASGDAKGALGLLRGGDARDRVARGEALLASGDAAGAFRAFRETSDALERGGVRDALFWRAWRRTLEILESQNADGARTPTVRREIARLRTLDPDLGGGVDGAAIVAVERRAGAKSSESRSTGGSLPSDGPPRRLRGGR